MTVPPLLGVVAGLAAEARMAAAIARVDMIALSGATATGARRAADALVAAGATHLRSFGFAAGLDPRLRSGTILLPRTVLVGGNAFPTDPELRALFARVDDATDPLLHSDVLVCERAAKKALRDGSGCAALDMESGAVAVAARRAGLPFAVLRAVCDPADTTLPPAARIPLRPNGGVDGVAVARSILFRPAQLPSLLRLGRDLRAAQEALRNGLLRATMRTGLAGEERA